MTFPAACARSLRPTPGGALLLVTLVAAAGPARAQEEVVEEEVLEEMVAVADGEAPRALIADALAAVGEEVRVFNDHLTILASPWMEGRLPGTRGMELAKEYMEFQFRGSGLVPAIPVDGGGASFRQPFNLGSTNEITAASLASEA